MQRPVYPIYRPVDVALETALVERQFREILARSRKVLESSVPDTFLGRQRREMVPPPHEEGQQPLSSSVHSGAG
jgi:hypothetical protein